MLAIKLRRIGKKHQPSYRLTVAEKRGKPQDPGVEDLGWVNPLLDKREIKAERVKYWLSQGAQPTDTVHNLLVSAGIIEGKKRPVHAKPKKKAEGEKKQPETPKLAEAAPAAEEKAEEKAVPESK